MNLLLVMATTPLTTHTYTLVPDTEDIRAYLFTHKRRKGRAAILEQMKDFNLLVSGKTYAPDYLNDLESEVAEEVIMENYLDVSREVFRNSVQKSTAAKAARLVLASAAEADSAVEIVALAERLGGTVTREVRGVIA